MVCIIAIGMRVSLIIRYHSGLLPDYFQSTQLLMRCLFLRFFLFLYVSSKFLFQRKAESHDQI